MASKYKRLDSYKVPVQRRRADTGEEPLRIVLLGKTGTGKSSLANTIFRNQVFEINHTANSATSQCMRATREVNGTTVSLIDTPDFFYHHHSDEDLNDEIAKCVSECSPGPHAFLILLRVERFTEQEEEVITKIKKYFSEDVFKYAVLVFTHGDQLPGGMQIKDLCSGNDSLRELLEKCGGRCHVFDNKYWNNNPQNEYRNNQRQIEKLLKTIKEMVENNRGCYSNEMLREVERRLRQEEELIRSSSGNMSQEEVREQAKKKVYNILKKAAGITTGVLLGALLGVPAMIALVVKILMSGEIPLAAVMGPVVKGAIVGCQIGYEEADKADSVMEAVGNTVKVLIELVINPVKSMGNTMK